VVRNFAEVRLRCNNCHTLIAVGFEIPGVIDNVAWCCPECKESCQFFWKAERVV